MKNLFTLLALWIVSQIGNAQGIGIGTTSPHAPLQFANLTANRKIVLWEIENNDHRFYGFGINGGAMRYQVSDTLNQHIFYAGVNGTTSKELLRITGRGYVGIGTTTPHAPLQFDATPANRKIVLSETQNNDHIFYGFGTELLGLRYQVAGSAYNHIFYSGINSTSSKELMRITGGGLVGIATQEPSENLEIGGNGRAFFGNGAGADRSGLLIDGIENNNASRIEAFNYPGGPGRNLIINTSGGGFVGINNANPHAPLQFSNDNENRKIVFWEPSFSEPNDHEFIGIGMDVPDLRYQVTAASFSHVFYAGTSPTTSKELVRIQGNGNVGINKTIPTEKLDVDGNGLFTGTVTASCGIFTCSDMRFKTRITPLNNSLQKVMALNGMQYYWDKEHHPEKNFTDDRQVGVSAQELETVLPELVHTDADGYKTVDYSRLTPVLIEAVKEQQRQIEKLQQQVKMLVEMMTPAALVKSE